MVLPKTYVMHILPVDENISPIFAEVHKDVDISPIFVGVEEHDATYTSNIGP